MQISIHFSFKGNRMSQESVERVIGKIVLSASFRQSLLADPKQALQEMDLTPTEISNLRYIDAETMDSLAKIMKSCSCRWKTNH